MSAAELPPVDVPFILTVRAQCKLCKWEHSFSLNDHTRAAHDAAKHLADAHADAADAIMQEWKP